MKIYVWFTKNGFLLKSYRYNREYNTFWFDNDIEKATAEHFKRHGFKSKRVKYIPMGKVM